MSLRFVRAGNILPFIYSRINQKSGATLKQSTINLGSYLISTPTARQMPSWHSLWLRHVYGHEVNALVDEKDTFAPVRRSSRQRARLSHVGLRHGCTPEGAVAK
jgi:hypothetical protein